MEAPKLLKILAIDDVPANLSLLGKALGEEYNLQIATSGAKGLSLAQEDPPDLILLDIMMPDMDGYETCQRLKQDPKLQEVPIIFVTALLEKHAEMKGLALGAVDYLTKPINIDIAKLRIHNLLEREQLRREIQLRESEQRLAASVFANTHDGIMITDVNNHIIEVNNAFTRITGYHREEVLGKKPSLLKSGRQSAEFYADLWKTLLIENHWNGEIWNRQKNGDLYAALTSISIVRDEQGHIHHFIGLFADITSLKNHEYDLERVAHFDSLTGIPNRLLLADRMAQALAYVKRSGNQMALCYLDLDGFKQINDEFGHEAGDQLLLEIAKRIKQCLRNGDTVARIGGDEFVLLLLELTKISECETIIERMLHVVAEPITLSGCMVSVSASLGFTLFPEDNADAETLVRHADQAMYIAKQSGKNRYHRFDPTLDRLILARGEFQAQIENALNAQEFELYFQPKVNMRTGAILGAEALIRWRHPFNGLLLPIEFLPMICESDLIVKLGDWVITQTLHYLTLWQTQGMDMTISVNIAPRHLLQADFVAQLERHFSNFPTLKPNCLELEILETAAIEDIGKVSAIMHECQKLGVSFALDDFGTGYSSLTYLKTLPANTLKIDQSFIRNMLNDPEDYAIVEAIINLTQIFHRQVIAEGVETIEHGLELLKLGCEQSQGYAIAKPMPFEALIEWSSRWQQLYQNSFMT